MVWELAPFAGNYSEKRNGRYYPAYIR
jgi:hypothetical protein